MKLEARRPTLDLPLVELWPYLWGRHGRWLGRLLSVGVPVVGGVCGGGGDAGDGVEAAGRRGDVEARLVPGGGCPGGHA